MKHHYPLLSWVEAQEAAAAGRIPVLPVGTVDANGPQVPMGYDFLVAEALAREAAIRTDNLWLPGLAYGVSEALDSFPGTVAMPPEALATQVDAVVRSLLRSGFERVLLVTNHGPNQYPVEYTLRRIRRDTGVVVPSINPARLATDLGTDLVPRHAGVVGHGAEPGTSLMMHVAPGAVRTDLARAGERSSFQQLEVLDPSTVRFGSSTVNFFLELEEVSPSAGWSDPTRASAQIGEELFARMLDHVCSFLGHYAAMDPRPALPEPRP